YVARPPAISPAMSATMNRDIVQPVAWLVLLRKVLVRKHRFEVQHPGNLRLVPWDKVDHVARLQQRQVVLPRVPAHYLRIQFTLQVSVEVCKKLALVALAVEEVRPVPVLSDDEPNDIRRVVGVQAGRLNVEVDGFGARAILVCTIFYP